MRLKSIKIGNYKSFGETQVIEFENGCNVIIGSNNSGKTSILDSISIRKNIPHRSLIKPLNHLNPGGARSYYELTFHASVSSLFTAITHKGELDYILPQTRLDFTNNAEWLCEQARDIGNFSENLEIIVSCNATPEASSVRIIELSLPEIERSILLDEIQLQTMRITDHGNGPTPGSEIMRNARGLPPSSFSGIGNSFFKNIYRLSPNRSPAGKSSVQNHGELESDASNLASCIHYLGTTNRHKHQDLCRLIKRVFPEINWIQAPLNSEKLESTQIECLLGHSSDSAPELKISLEEMGSGCGAAISILYLIASNSTSKILCIDELNQFLHPRALRELLLIMRTEGRRHQYILTAHSADVLASVDAATITVLTLDRGVTKVVQTDTAGIKGFRAGLAELGIRPTDLHSRDRVLWVEGQTEELVFPKLIAHFCPLQAAGTAVIRVHSTGVFDRKGSDAVAIAESYQKLSSGASIVPPMVAIVLDSEGRSAKVRKELEADKRAVLRFLPCKMLENYALHPEAIKAALQARGEVIETTTIEEALLAEAKVDSLDALDLEGVDGAKLLIALFSSLTEARIEFRKTLDTPEMFTWLLEHAPEHLESLGDWIRALLKEVQ